MHIGELPQWLGMLVYRLEKEGYMPEGTDQVIINEYQPGQGISSHIGVPAKALKVFGSTLRVTFSV